MSSGMTAAGLLATICFAQHVPTSCRTPFGVPCYTVHFQTDDWEYFRRGPLDIRHFTQESIQAARSDGSSYQSRSDLSVAIYLTSRDEVVRIFPNDRTFSSRSPLIWHDRPYRRSADNDGVCRTGILHWGTDFRQEGQASIAVVPVFRWVRGNGQHGDEEIFLAPSLDCLPLKTRSLRFGRFYIPIAIQDMEATSVIWGEPDPSLFVIPANYKQVEDPGLPSLLRYLDHQRR
jgi:hypothetical protein